MSTSTVVVNEQGQYSLWSVDRPLPAGWAATGFTGEASDCLAHIESVWLDVLPRAARRSAPVAPEHSLVDSLVTASGGGHV